MSALLALLSGAALADPLALRAPVRGELVLAGGAPELSAGAWIRDDLGVALEVRLPLSAIGASVGSRRTLLGPDAGWGVDGGLAGGLAVPLLSPGLAVTLTPAIQAGWRGERLRAVLGVASPGAVQLLGGLEARLPVLVEPWLVYSSGRLELGLSAGAGAAAVPGHSPSVALQAGGVIALRP